jgi:fluoride exporter
MGCLAGLFVYRAGLVPQHARLFLTTGVLGGFTTFSTFSLDAALLVERSSPWMTFSYITGSVLVSVAALFAGLALFNGLRPLP